MASDFGGGGKGVLGGREMWKSLGDIPLRNHTSEWATPRQSFSQTTRRAMRQLSFSKPRFNNPPNPPNHYQPEQVKISSQQLHASPCGRKWFDCAECHAEQEKHPLLQSFELIFACKKCKKCFRKDTKEFEESDEYCPHCDNHFVIDAKTPKAALSIESEDVRVNNKMLRDERVKQQGFRTMFDPDEDADKLG
ncbi:hypothetical protein E4U61_007904 [Claviceps capensis]|nr:hypothetical protein E4U61_007904 [Claviceps capensis]